MADPAFPDIGARMTVVENTVGRLENTINTLAGTMQRYVENQSSQPKPLPLKEILATCLTTLALFAGIVSFFDGRTTSQVELTRTRIEATNSIQEYRLNELEKRIALK